MEQKRFSIKGRPRRLSEREIDRVLDWHRNHTSLADLARELNVCAQTVRNIIRREGRNYKQPPPERRAEVVQEVRRMREVLKLEGGA